MHDDQAPVWLFGSHAVHAALANPARACLRLVASRNAARDLPESAPAPEILDPDRIARLLPPGAVHQGLALLTGPLPELTLAEACAPADPARPVLALDHVTDPHNVGAILRSASAFGARALVLTRRRSPPVSGALAKVAAGALEHVPLVRVTNLARALGELKDLGYRLVGLDEKAPLTLAEALAAPAPTALVLGAEGEGMRKLTADTCDCLARLPTGGPVASLNVSNAAAITLYELARAAATAPRLDRRVVRADSCGG
jgi:23S rRNA (guanosine2251-2'-O)-methyltransferase